MTYTFVDTNLWVRFISQGKPGCEPAHFATLKRLMARKELVFLLPEIVELEMEKNWRTFTDNVTKEFGGLEKQIAESIKQLKWQEIQDIGEALSDFLAQQKEAKITNAEKHYKQVQGLFKDAEVIRLPLTHDLYLAAKKRLIAGRMPRPENQAHSDACIVEALVEFFKKRAKSEFYFCSENTKDFAVETEKQWVLHPLIREGLPRTKYFLTLKEMTEFHDSKAKISEPSKEEIDKAIESRLMTEEALRQFVQERRLFGPPLCSVTGCDEPTFINRYDRDLCAKHYVELTNSLIRANARQTCSVEGCKETNYDLNHFATPYCRRHYHEFMESRVGDFFMKMNPNAWEAEDKKEKGTE